MLLSEPQETILTPLECHAERKRSISLHTTGKTGHKVFVFADQSQAQPIGCHCYKEIVSRDGDSFFSESTV